MYNMMTTVKTYCGSHFKIHVSQILLYTLNTYTVVYQLYLNKNGENIPE